MVPSDQVLPEATVARLPLYVRELRRIVWEGMEEIHSHELGPRLGMPATQVRKDLSYLGRFGNGARGYPVRELLEGLVQVLGLNQQWRVAIVGMGRLGRGIVQYPGFIAQGFRIEAAFDVDPGVVGQCYGEIRVEDVRSLRHVIRAREIEIAIVAVPSAQAQEVVDQLTAAGVKAILNYAPMPLKVPPGVTVRTIDPIVALQAMTYHLRRRPALEYAGLRGRNEAQRNGSGRQAPTYAGRALAGRRFS